MAFVVVCTPNVYHLHDDPVTVGSMTYIVASLIYSYHGSGVDDAAHGEVFRCNLGRLRRVASHRRPRDEGVGRAFDRPRESGVLKADVRNCGSSNIGNLSCVCEGR